MFHRFIHYFRCLTAGIAVFSIAALPVGAAAADDRAFASQSRSYLVQASDLATARSVVARVGGNVVTDLAVIRAVGAVLSAEQLEALQARAGIRVYENAEVAVDGRRNKSGKADSTDAVADTSSWGSWSEWDSSRDDTAWWYDGRSYDADFSALQSIDEGDAEAVELSADYLRTTQSNGWLDWSELARSMESIDFEHPLLVSAPDVHKLGLDGKGVTVGVIDTGLWWEAGTLLSKSALTFIDVTGQDLEDDPNGHGTHVASIIGSDRLAKNGIYEGIAPRSDIAVLRAFRADGSASYLDVIRAIDVAVANRDKYNIRVLNLSFSATPQSHYWDDPLNQAVMAAWQSGIVVVASAGNGGPDAMSIGVPGNVPYIITVGAMTDNYTPYEPTDDRLASFSSAGPTFEGFVKPDVIAPGGHIVSSMPFDSYISLSHPDSMMGSERNFAMSGTSQATAIVSGIVALMLENDPSLTPDDVKCRLIATARPAVDDNGELAYTIFQQGAGLANALDAVNASITGCANQGLDIARDLSGEQHFGGRANRSEEGEYYLMDDDGERLEGDGYLWSRGYAWSQGYVWSQAYLWSQGYAWSQGYIWGQSYIWSQSVPWQDGAVFSSGLTDAMSINKWVDHE